MRWNNAMRDSMRIKLDYNNMMEGYVQEEGFSEKQLNDASFIPSPTVRISKENILHNAVHNESRNNKKPNRNAKKLHRH